MNETKSLKFLVILPFLSVFFQVGILSSGPQLQQMYENAFYTSTFIAITPLVTMIFGSLWGPILKILGERKTFGIALLGWILSVILITIFLSNPILGIVFRGMQGIFDAVFFSIALAGVSKSQIEGNLKAKYYGAIEFMASFGSIVGPLIIGTGFVFNPKYVLILVIVSVSLYAILGYKSIENIKIESMETKKGKFSPKIFLATFFGIVILSTIVSNQAVLPGFGEDSFNSPIVGKILVSVFGAFIMLGNMLKHKIKGVRYWIPMIASVMLFIAYIFINFVFVYLLFTMITGFLLGLSLTMSSEYASKLSKGFEETGMTVYSSLRISGNFIGPYLAGMFTHSNLIIIMSVLTLASTGFLKVSKE